MQTFNVRKTPYKTVVNRREVHNTNVLVNRVDNLPGCWWRNFLYTPIFLLSSALTSPIVSNNSELGKQIQVPITDTMYTYVLPIHTYSFH